MPLPEEIERDLTVIDRTLAGHPVDPNFADLAELALLLADSRPAVPEPVITNLDRRVGALASTPRRRRLPQLHGGILRPAMGAGLAVAVILAVLVVVLPRLGGSPRATSSSGGSAVVVARTPSGHRGPAAAAATSTSSANSSANSSASGSIAVTPDSKPLQSLSPPSPQSGGAFSPVAPTPQSNGRRIVQSSQLSLTAPSARISVVAQELFDVVGAQAGIVEHSSVSSGTNGYADFTLSIPTANLPATLAQLARLRYASVASSMESSTDVNSRYLDDVRALTDAKVLHTSLLRQLQNADSTTAVDSLESQIRDAEASISGDEATLNGLQSRISDTAVSVQINPGAQTAAQHSAGGFTLVRAGRDALDVLAVAAGVLLIALAVLVPLALVLGLATLARRVWRHERRERALDAA